MTDQITAPSDPALDPTADPATGPYAVPASRERLEHVIAALAERGVDARIVSRDDVRAAVDALIPDDALVYTATSHTLDELGVAADVRTATRYRQTRAHTETLDPATQMDEFRRHVSTMDVIVGSVHAVTEGGHVVVASASGSQIAAYAFGASRVIWVVGAQKVVTDLDDAFARIEQHSLPLEDRRLQAAYGMPSYIGKQLVISRDQPGRSTMLLLEDAVGF
ncbi:MAG TPA: LUD domain-containing protein [Nocardioides sp.]|nr:LUD domain-containing protein [Nocardioides sp.]